MNPIRQFKVGLLVIALAVGATGAALTPLTKFDEFGDVNCEREMASLDNLALQLQQQPDAKGVIIFYGGKTFRGKLPRRGEAAARAARLKPYLVQRRGVPADRITVIDGGYAEQWRAEIWIVSTGASMPTPNPTIPVQQIKFRKGRVNPRAYRCEI